MIIRVWICPLDRKQRHWQIKCFPWRNRNFGGQNKTIIMKYFIVILAFFSISIFKVIYPEFLLLSEPGYSIHHSLLHLHWLRMQQRRSVHQRNAWWLAFRPHVAQAKYLFQIPTILADAKCAQHSIVSGVHRRTARLNSSSDQTFAAVWAVSR